MSSKFYVVKIRSANPDGNGGIIYGPWVTKGRSMFPQVAGKLLYQFQFLPNCDAAAFYDGKRVKRDLPTLL